MKNRKNSCLFILLGVLLLTISSCSKTILASSDKKQLPSGFPIPPAGKDYILSQTAAEKKLQYSKEIRTYYAINQDEMEIAKSLLKAYMESGVYQRNFMKRIKKSLSKSKRYATLDKDTINKYLASFVESQTPFPLEEYNRQYFGYKENGDLKVYVNLVYPDDFYKGDLTTYLIEVLDGGNYFGHAVINLTKKKVEWFGLNAVA